MGQRSDRSATSRSSSRDGVVVLGPGSGDQACGETGDGRMLEPEEIFAAVNAWAQPKLLAGKRVLLTAGPTFEAIDPVRGITNTSSGKMGFALAQAAAEAGATVTLVSGPTPLPTPAGVARIDVTSAAQMAAAVDANLDGVDVFIAVAAVADYTPDAPADSKIKKSACAADDRAEADRRHSRHGRGTAGCAVLRRLRRRNERCRAQRRRRSAAARSCR